MRTVLEHGAVAVAGERTVSKEVNSVPVLTELIVRETKYATNPGRNEPLRSIFIVRGDHPRGVEYLDAPTVGPGS